MIDLSTELPTKLLARAVNEADKLEVVDAETLRTELDERTGQFDVKRLVALLDKDSFVLTQEELKRLFLPIAREVGLPLPRTGEVVNGYPARQAKNARRGQVAAIA